MGISTGDVFGSDQIGVFVAVVGKTIFHPLELEKDVVETLESTLDLETKGLLIGGSRLIGSLLAGNSHGLAVADLATEQDVDILTSYGDVVVMESGINTAGNLLVCTDEGILASPELPDDGLAILGPVVIIDTPGSLEIDLLMYCLIIGLTSFKLILSTLMTDFPNV